MKTTIPIVLIIVLFFTACNPNTAQTNSALDKFIADLDNTSLEEVENELNQNIEQIEQFLKFFEGPFSGEIKEIDKENERYIPPFSIDITIVEKAITQFEGILFTQTYNDYESNLEFAFPYNTRRSLISLDEGIYEEFTPQKIYYRDGTFRTEKIADYQTNFDFPYGWGKTAIIDSVEIKYTVKYVEDYNTVKLSKKNPKATYESGEVLLKKLENNYAYITLSDTISGLMEIAAFNNEGKRLNQNASTENTIDPKDSKKVFADLIKKMKKVHKKLENNDFEDMAAFKTYLKKELKDSEFFNDTDGVYHRERFYEGKIAYIEVYFKNEEREKQKIFTAVNMNPYKSDELIAMETEDGWEFVSQNGENMYTMKSDDDDLEHLKGYYFENDQNYFFFNKEKNTLDKLLIYDLDVFHNGLVGVQHNNEAGDYQLYDANYEPIPNGAYTEFQEAGDILFGNKNEKVFLINSEGKSKHIKGISEVEDKVSDNRILVSTKDYSYGFIDGEGNLVIPAIYEDANSFYKGISAVASDGVYKLIDINGKIIVDTGAEDKSMDDEDADGNRIYSFDYGDKKYNYKGELIFEE